MPDYLPQLHSLWSTHRASYHPILAPILRFVFLAQSYAYRYVYPVLVPIYTLFNNALHSISSDSPDLLTLLLLGVILIVSARVLDYVRRTIFFWIAFAFKILFYTSLAGVGIYIWQRGIEQSLEDFVILIDMFEGMRGQAKRKGGQKARGYEREAERVQYGGRGGRRSRGNGW